MTTATVTRTRTIHPTLMASSIGALGVAIGLLAGIGIGTRLAADPATPSSVLTSKISSEVSTVDNPYASTQLTMPAGGSYVLPSSAPGNPYVNIHVAGEVPAPAAPQDSAGTRGYVNKAATGDAGNRGLQDQRRGERAED
jgi:hypothetical protein